MESQQNQEYDTVCDSHKKFVIFIFFFFHTGTPKGVDFNMVKDTLLSISGVKALHSLHIWALTVSQPVLSVHIAISKLPDNRVCVCIL